MSYINKHQKKWKLDENGESYLDIAKRNGITPAQFYTRLKQGLTPPQASGIRILRGIEKARLIVENRIKAKELGVDNLNDLYLLENEDYGVSN